MTVAAWPPKPDHCGPTMTRLLMRGVLSRVVVGPVLLVGAMVVSRMAF
jgi:hypothetical protein